MATRTPLPTPELLTYEAYLAEGEINQRYDILDGVRIYMPAPTWSHQEILLNIAEALRGYQRASGSGRVVVAPFDVIIRRVPKLQTRQPDVLFITNDTLTRGGGVPKRGGLEVSPELIVEILSDSERQHMVAGKLADYITIGVKEAWLVRPDAQTVEVVRLTPNGPVPVTTYDATQTLQSLTFPDLTLPVADFFQP
jgi:Uma2 family endonuclease